MQRFLHCSSRRVVLGSGASPFLRRVFPKDVQRGLHRICDNSHQGVLSKPGRTRVWRRSFASSPWPSPVRRPDGLRQQRTRVSSDGYTHFVRQNSPSGQQPLTRYLLYIAAGGTIYYVYSNIDYAPFTGRVRLLGVSRDSEMELGRQAYEDLLHGFGKTLLAPNDGRTLRVRRVVTRLARTVNKIDANLAKGFKWSVAVADVAEPNAMCVPGGKIVITTGLMRILKSDDDIAVVLGHEIAHALNRHGVESMSLQRLLLPLVMVINQLVDARFMASLFVTLFLSLPYSRRLEHEADQIGLMLASEACYDPRVAPEVFGRLGALQNEHGGGSKTGKMSAFFSTHPHTEERAKRLRKQLVEEVERYNRKCVDAGDLRRFSQGFGRV